jgi:hypothetical protein
MVDANCNANCNASVHATAECSAPKLQITAQAAASENIDRAIAALEAHLPALLTAVKVRLVDLQADVKALADGTVSITAKAPSLSAEAGGCAVNAIGPALAAAGDNIAGAATAGVKITAAIGM